MCGRYTLYTTGELYDRFSVPPEPNNGNELKASYNVAPGQLMPVIVSENDSNRLSLMSWGLVPVWARDPNIAFHMFNARDDSVSTKPSFKAAFHRHRCLVPANGFYEWRKDGSQKIPYYFTVSGCPLFAFAGLWENGTYTIITTEPNNLVGEVHDRMPVILEPSSEKIWLDKKSGEDTLKSLLKPYPSQSMNSVSVSFRLS